MKTDRLFIILSLFIICQCSKDVVNQDILIEEDHNWGLILHDGACFPDVSDKYVYPIVPGMEEWNNLGCFETPVEIFCQLPDSILKTISTSGLIDALIYAPMFTGFTVISNEVSVLKWHSQYGQFNSAEELFKRENAGDALVAYYKLVNLNRIKSQYAEYERLMGLEALFTKQQILDKMSHDKKKQAVAVLLTNYEQHNEESIRIFSMAFIMYADKYEPVIKYSKDNKNKFDYILNGYFYSLDQKDLIASYAKKFINDK
jgi:hypothetical protein